MSDNDKRQKMIEKIRKLLALAQSANEHEAALAAERAQAMLAEYNIALSEVATEEKDAEDENIVIEVGGMTSSYPWRRPLASAVAKMYFCEYFFQTIRSRSGSTDQHSFVGAAHNVSVACMMFKYLDETIDRLAKQGALSVPANQRSPFRTAFRAACSLRVQQRIMQRIADAKAGKVQATEGGKNLPALLNLYESWDARNKAHINDKVGPLRTRVSKLRTSLHVGGASAGREAGDRVGLDPQVGKGAKVAGVLR